MSFLWCRWSKEKAIFATQHVLTYISNINLNILHNFSREKKNLGPVFKFHCWNVTQDIGQAQQNIAPINVAPLAHPLNCVPYGQNIWKWRFIIRFTCKH